MSNHNFSFFYFYQDSLNEDLIRTKKSFGGLSVYYDDKLVSALMESPDVFEWRKKKYDIELWYGVMIPTSQEHHSSLKKQIKSLVPHPVLGKWLFLPARSKNFESDLEKIIEIIRKKDPRIGV